MRNVAMSVLLIGNLFANQMLAEDVSLQPLTRLDCDKAGMAWDDNATFGKQSSGVAVLPPAEHHRVPGQ